MPEIKLIQIKNNEFAEMSIYTMNLFWAAAAQKLTRTYSTKKKRDSNLFFQTKVCQIHAWAIYCSLQRAYVALFFSSGYSCCKKELAFNWNKMWIHCMAGYCFKQVTLLSKSVRLLCSTKTVIPLKMCLYVCMYVCDRFAFFSYILTKCFIFTIIFVV